MYMHVHACRGVLHTSLLMQLTMCPGILMGKILKDKKCSIANADKFILIGCEALCVCIITGPSGSAIT